MKNTYSAPAIERVACFKKSTRGLRFGGYRDIFGGRAIINISINFG